eukprot:446453_1
MDECEVPFVDVDDTDDPTSSKTKSKTYFTLCGYNITKKMFIIVAIILLTLLILIIIIAAASSSSADDGKTFYTATYYSHNEDDGLNIHQKDLTTKQWIHVSEYTSYYFDGHNTITTCVYNFQHDSDTPNWLQTIHLSDINNACVKFYHEFNQNNGEVWEDFICYTENSKGSDYLAVKYNDDNERPDWYSNDFTSIDDTNCDNN